MADDVRLLNAEEVAAMRRNLDLFPYVMADERERIVATLEALLAERDAFQEALEAIVRLIEETARPPHHWARKPCQPPG